MKRSKIEQVVAEMQAEKLVVDTCIVKLQHAEQDAAVLSAYGGMLDACIARLSGNGTEAPKPARTRKSRKATELPTIVSNSNPKADGVLR